MRQRLGDISTDRFTAPWKGDEQFAYSSLGVRLDLHLVFHYIEVILTAVVASIAGRIRRSAAWTRSWRTSRVLWHSCRRRSKSCRWKLKLCDRFFSDCLFVISLHSHCPIIYYFVRKNNRYAAKKVSIHQHSLLFWRCVWQARIAELEEELEAERAGRTKASVLRALFGYSLWVVLLFTMLLLGFFAFVLVRFQWK